MLLYDNHLDHVANLATPEPPTAMAMRGDGTGLLVGWSGDGHNGLSWLSRPGKGTAIERSLQGPPLAVALDVEGRLAFALLGGSPGTLSIRQPDSLKEVRALTVCGDPVALAFSPDGDRAYVTCAPGSISEVDTRLRLVVRTEFFGADSGRACGSGRSAISASGAVLYVPCARTGRLLYLDRVTLQPRDSATVGRGASLVAATPQGVAIVALPDSDRVVLVRLDRRERYATVSISRPLDVALTAGGERAFVLSGGRGAPPGAIWELDLRSGSRIRTTVLGAAVTRLVVWPGLPETRMAWESGDRR